MGHLGFKLRQGEVPLILWVVRVGAGHDGKEGGFEKLDGFLGSVGAVDIRWHIFNLKWVAGNVALSEEGTKFGGSDIVHA